MSPWQCALFITVAGGMGGVINAFLTDNGFPLPRRQAGVWCPGAISNVLIGAFAAFASWSFYGSGASVDLAHESQRAVLSFKFSAIAGALLVGVGGARWITNEVDKQLLKESIKVAGEKKIPREECEQLVRGPATQVLKAVQEA